MLTSSFQTFLLCLLFFLQGITALLPWNVFITNAQYFVEYKMNSTDPSTQLLRHYFLNYLAVSFIFIMIIFSFVNLFINLTCHLFLRMAASLTSILVLLAVVVIMIFIPFHDVKSFFGITMAIICLVSVFNGLYQSSVYGSAAGFPDSCIKALQVGASSSGVFTSIFVILSYQLSSNPRTSALIYFMAAIVAILLSILSTPFLKKLKMTMLRQGEGCEEDMEGSLKGSREGCVAFCSMGRFKEDLIEYLAIANKARVPLIAMFLNNTVSLGCFPGLIAKIEPLSANPSLQNPLFTMVFVFLFFNVFMLIGSVVNFCKKLLIPNKAALILSLLRVGFVPIFIFCNISPASRSQQVFFGDSVFIVANLLLSLSHGYLLALFFVKTPLEVEVKWRVKAGMVAACVNILGIFTGVASSLLLLYLV